MPIYEYRKDGKTHQFNGVHTVNWAFGSAQEAFGRGGELFLDGVLVAPIVRTCSLHPIDEGYEGPGPGRAVVVYDADDLHIK